MSFGGLALEKAPALGVPGRFFVTAPFFGVAAAGVLLVLGGDVLASRWSPVTLAAVHLVTLGVLTMTMCGAWMQLLPVLVAAPIARAQAVSVAVHAPLALGAALLPLGLASGPRSCSSRAPRHSRARCSYSSLLPPMRCATGARAMPRRPAWASRSRRSP